MTKHLALLPHQDVTAVPQLRNVFVFEGIQSARQDRLLGKLGAPPGTRQRKVGAQTHIDLGERATPGQDADQQILHFLGGCMVYGLDRQLQRSPHRRQKFRPRQTVTQYAQRRKSCLVRHGDQTDDGFHGTPPL